jgi:DNA-binding NarL/FixJ family response regulator
MEISILLADGHNILRQGLKVLLEQEKNLCVLADTDDGARAVELCLALHPDVAILEIVMPTLDGIEAARRILASGQGTKVIFLSMHLDKDSISAALSSGARGVLAKNCTSQELINAIHRVVAGEHYLSSTISGPLVALITTPQLDLQSSFPRQDSQLSQRENQVLRLLAEGHCTKEIASQLNLSTKSVETYRLNLMKKLKIVNIATLVRYAIREGIVELT